MTARASKALVQRLKAEIPAACRRFDPETKVWTVHEPYIMPAVGLVYAVTPGVVIEDRWGTRASWRPTEPTRRDPDYAALHLLPKLNVAREAIRTRRVS